MGSIPSARHTRPYLAAEGAVSELAAGTEGDIFSPIRTFSGGIKRKLQIVHSLIHPKVILLAEVVNPLRVLPIYLDILSRISPMRYAADLTCTPSVSTVPRSTRPSSWRGWWST